MSAYLLMDTLRRVGIEDELESFFHILIYYAARYLKSSLRTDEDAAHFLEKCYDCFTVTGERIICGSQKWALFKPGAVDIVFDHPEYTETHPVKFASEGLNDVISEMLSCFQARYKIFVWERWLAKHPNHPSNPQRRDRFQTPPPPKRRRIDSNGKASDTGSGDDEGEDEPITERIPDPPTANDRELAANLTDHQFMVDQFSYATRNNRRWKGADKLPDRVLPNYKCHYPLLDTLPKTEATPAASS